MVQPARTETVVIPAQYGSIERRTLVTPEKAEWRQVLCEANASPEVVRAIQSALKREGYYTGAIDGRLGQQTYASVERYQQALGLSTGGLTLTTVDRLGVDWRSMVSGNQLTTGGFSTGGTTTGATGGFTSGTTITSGGSAGSAAGYTIGSNGSVTDARGVVIGTLNANGDVVNSAGQVVLRGLSATGGSAGGIGGLASGAGGLASGASGVSAGGFSVQSDGSVTNSSGAVNGRVNANGEIISNGVVIGRVR